MAKGNYFQSIENYFWHWEEQGEVVSIPGGSTIAYRAFLKEIIPVLSLQGLPPFGALLLAIIATNANGKQLLNELDSLIMDDNTEEERARAKDFLMLLTSVPEEFKRGSKKLQLFQAIFEKCHGVGSIKNTREIIGAISSPELDDCLTPAPYSRKVLIRDLRVFSVLAPKLTTVQQILDKIAALPELPDLFELLEPPFEAGKEAPPTDFISELIANDRTRPVGTLIKHLWGGLNIPVHSSLPSSQPLGGISDLTNKGDFDKLLVSEFANDDLVFLSRLANNEALYIQREIPPQQNNLERIILIDSSLKNWGTPKTVAFAIMLAISKHPKTDIPCRSYVIGEKYKEIDSNSISSLIDALSELDAQLNAVNGLTDYLNDFPPGKEQELFVITEQSILKQSSMLKAVNEFHHAVAYWIYTDAVGNIDVYKKQQHSKRLLQHIQLPLEELWKKESAPRKVHRGAFRGEYPILFYPSNGYEYVPAVDGKTCLLVSNDSKLFRFSEEFSRTEFTTNNTKGLELIWDKIPFRGQYEIGWNSDGNQVLVIVDPHENQCILYNLSTRIERPAFFDKNTISKGGLHYDGGNFRYRSSKGNWVIHPDIALATPDHSESFETNQQFREAKQSVLNKIPGLNTQRNILKNIYSISISEQRNLVFNNHELRFNHHSGTIKIVNCKTLNKIAKSTETISDEFTFDDGSKIEVNRSGMLILKSSNPSVPTIFVPSVLDTKIGVATQNAFCGDEFFKKTEAKSLTTVEFQNAFIEPFIKNILTYGA